MRNFFEVLGVIIIVPAIILGIAMLGNYAPVVAIGVIIMLILLFVGLVAHD